MLRKIHNISVAIWNSMDDEEKFWFKLQMIPNAISLTAIIISIIGIVNIVK